MVATRKQAALKEAADAPDNLTKRAAPENSSLKPTSPDAENEQHYAEEEPPTKKVKLETPQEEKERKQEESSTYLRAIGTIERGHIYFFFRPRVEQDSPESIDDVKNLHMLLVPNPPKFSAHVDDSHHGNEDMTVLKPGDDVVPAAAVLDAHKKHYRLITIGKKVLPDPEARTGGRKQTFWATVVAVGDDLDALEKGLGEKTYETKTRGTRHDPPARLAARGYYALVNNEPSKSSQAATHLGYSLSHPDASAFGPVQTALGIQRAAAFALQVKNPLAPASDTAASTNKSISYPPDTMEHIFGKGTRGRDPSGLKFAPCERAELLDYEGAELLLIAVRGGEKGLEQSLGEGRGEALVEAGEEDDMGVEDIFRELWTDAAADTVPEALNGEWI
ncbi:hypothetical protein C8J57DRAFT_1707172 [Mycena rebaudengoi]|nr:hypothetical protein C8J57DRAFT_1707172 [Mycena rebaudengoi]